MVNIFFQYILLASINMVHPFFVSMTEFDYNSKDKELERNALGPKDQACFLAGAAGLGAACPSRIQRPIGPAVPRTTRLNRPAIDRPESELVAYPFGECYAAGTVVDLTLTFSWRANHA